MQRLTATCPFAEPRSQRWQHGFKGAEPSQLGIAQGQGAQRRSGGFADGRSKTKGAPRPTGRPQCFATAPLRELQRAS